MSDKSLKNFVTNEKFYGKKKLYMKSEYNKLT